MSKELDLPPGSVILSVSVVQFIITKEVAARLVEAGTAFLCGNCPRYHVSPSVIPAIMTGAFALDLREAEAEVTVDPALAARLDAIGKGGHD